MIEKQVCDRQDDEISAATSANEAEGESKSVIIVALGINLTIAFFKTLCSVVTMSSAMLSESVHSFVDCGNQVLQLIGMQEAKRKPTAQHPLGFHRSEYIYAFLVPTMIFIGGAATSLYEGIGKIIHPEPLQSVQAFGHSIPGWTFNLAVLGVSIVLEGYGLKNAWSAFRSSHRGSFYDAISRTKDAGIMISILEDGGAVIGLGLTVMFTLLTAITGNAVYDGLGAVAVGLLLLAISYFLGRETKSLAIGENNPIISDFAVSIAKGLPEVTRVNHCMAIHLGPASVLVLSSIDWENDTPAGRVETCSLLLERAVKAKFPIVSRVYIEARDPDTEKTS